MSQLKFTSWALEQVKSSGVSEEMAQSKVQALVDALAALRGKAGGQVFGMGADRIEPKGRHALEATLIAALGEWKTHFQSRNDPVSLMALDRAGKALGLPGLRISERFPLRCDPLGTREGLSADWLSRLDRLEEARAGKRKLNLTAIRLVGFEEGEPEPEIAFGRPNPKMLYERAIRHEAQGDSAFPQELAAFWTIADGVSIRGDPVLRPIADWFWDFEDRGLCIGCGGYMQGSLILETPAPDQLLAAEVVDVDDDGVERARYPNFAAFADALLGTT